MSEKQGMVGQSGETPHDALTTHSHEGHGETRFEADDAKPGIVIWSLLIIAGTLGLVFAISIPIQRFLYNANPQGDLPSPLAPERVLPPSPQIEVHPWNDLPGLRAHEDEVLKGSGQGPDGRMHIPIDRAMDAVVPRLNIRPDAQPGITTPGGEGRKFGGGQNENRRPYRIEINAEAEKRAK